VEASVSFLLAWLVVNVYEGQDDVRCIHNNETDARVCAQGQADARARANGHPDGAWHDPAPHDREWNVSGREYWVVRPHEIQARVCKLEDGLPTRDDS
jgi:uncharacterized protein YfaQ (DUF2300 family)